MQPTIVVRGEAVREVPPEIAVINVSVTARGKNKDAVLVRLTEQSAVLRAELDAYGEAIERRETAGVQVYPDFKKSGYVGNVDTTVTVADFGALGEMLPRLAGMAQVSIFGPWWQLRRGSKAGAEVRRAAITDALDRAREYASAVGARIDKLVEISDEIAGAGGVVPIAARAMAFDAQRGPTPALELDPQRQTVQASVLVRVTITEPDLSEQSQ